MVIIVTFVRKPTLQSLRLKLQLTPVRPLETLMIYGSVNPEGCPVATVNPD